MTSTESIVVVHECHERSLPALKLGIARSTASGRDLVVVHQAPIAVSVRNGPNPQIAAQLGNPVWATVHEWVLAAGADPARTATIIGSFPTADLITHHAPNPSLIITAPRSFRRWIWRRDLVDRLEARFDCRITTAPNDLSELSLVTTRVTPNRSLEVAA